jgi:hypothetical protein
VRAVERSGRLPARKAYRQVKKALASDNMRKVGSGCRGARQLAKAEFRRDLPCRCGADEDVVVCVLDCSTRRCASTISSPASTRASSCESVVLAIWMVTVSISAPG